MSASTFDSPAPEGPGSVLQAPQLPPGFTGTFSSRYIDADDGVEAHVTGIDVPAAERAGEPGWELGCLEDGAGPLRSG